MKVHQVYGVTLCFVSHGVKLQKSIVDIRATQSFFGQQILDVSQLSMFGRINFKTLLSLYKILMKMKSMSKNDNGKSVNVGTKPPVSVFDEIRL